MVVRPTETARAPIIQSGVSSDPPPDAIRILLVEPQKMVETALRALLDRKYEFSVVGSVAHGRDVLEVAKKTKPTVAIIDMMLSDVTAVEVTQRLRNDCPNIRVLALSSDTHWGSVISMFRAGAWGFVTKEGSFDDLEAALKSISLGQRFVDGLTGGLLAAAWSELPGTHAEIALASLSQRENEVFRLLVEGKNAGEIAKVLYISRKTAETHRRVVLQKLKVRDIAELVKFAARNLLLKP